MMDYIACITLAFALLQLLVAWVNLLFQERLPARDVVPLPTLSLLIPARDEEMNIGRLLGDLTTINDRILEIIVCDDQSSDRTVELVEESAAHDSRIRLIRGDRLPDGWSGKNHLVGDRSRPANWVLTSGHLADTSLLEALREEVSVVGLHDRDGRKPVSDPTLGLGMDPHR